MLIIPSTWEVRSFLSQKATSQEQKFVKVKSLSFSFTQKKKRKIEKEEKFWNLKDFQVKSKHSPCCGVRHFFLQSAAAVSSGLSRQLLPLLIYVAALHISSMVISNCCLLSSRRLPAVVLAGGQQRPRQLDTGCSVLRSKGGEGMGKGTELEGKRVSIPALMASGLIEVRLLYMWPCGWVAMNSHSPSTHTDTNTFPVAWGRVHDGWLGAQQLNVHLHD